MAFSSAFWVAPNGKILDVNSNHIAQVIKSPKTFGVTSDYITSTYDKHGEKLGQEGDAREEIILHILKAGFLRIRRYRSRWSITLHRMDSRTKKNLSDWAEKARADKKSGAYFPVFLNIASTDKLIEVETVNNLWYGKYESTTYRKGFKEFMKDKSI
jgi:hypothetical protein